MKDRDIDKMTVKETKPVGDGRPSPLELMKRHGGRAHKVTGMAGRGADSMLAVYNDRFTYTFVMRKEVASIHFDRRSGKIYFGGHNIQNINLLEDQKRELLNVIKILEEDAEGKHLMNDYEATLTSLIADNK